MATIEDPTGWLIDSEMAKFLLLGSAEIGYMAMLAYTFLHGTSRDWRVRLKEDDDCC